jgi:hypothetical protein
VNPFDLLQSPVILLVYALIILAVLKIIAPDGIDYEDVLQLHTDREWPRGVQEEEPVRWRLDRLSPRREAGQLDGRRAHHEPSLIDRTADQPAR